MIRMDRIKLPISTADFERIREGKFYYIDKTRIISRIISDDADFILFTRPRRFGKTTLQTMLRSFFDIRKNSAQLFSGLDIEKDEAAVNGWMNKYPVIYLSLKDIDGATFESALYRFREIIIELFTANSFILDTEISKSDRNLFMKLMSTDSSQDDIAGSLKFLVRLLCSHFGKQVIVLIDEYDVPLDKANNNGYYPQMLLLLRSLFTSVLKDNPNVIKGIMTGCLRVSKESIFTGLNNLCIYSLTSPSYSDAFGFTEKEVSKLLSDSGLENKAKEIQNWYDGYRIGNDHIYASWDVLSYVKDHIANPDTPPKNYWANTSGNEIIKKLINETNAAISSEYTDLINGKTISRKINENLTYSDLYNSEDNLWSLLFETGYITLSGLYNENGETLLSLPNEEMKRLFIASSDSWFRESISKENLSDLFHAIWQDNPEKLSEQLSDYLFRTISYNDYSEAYYHAFLAGLFSSSEYTVKSNMESGNGRPDLLIMDMKRMRLAVFEFKIAKDISELEETTRNAIEQIKTNEYGEDLSYFKEIHRYAIVFVKKKAFATAI